MISWLKALGVLVLVVSCLPAAAGDRASSPSSSGPDLVVSPKAHHLGDLVPGQRAEQVFSLRNDGGEPLAIRLVRPSSHRLTTHLVDTQLPPGSAAELRVTLNSNLWDEGPFAEQVLLYSNDPDEPVAKVKIQGVIQDPLVWAPKSLGLSVRRGDTQPLPTLRISSKDGRPIGPVRITSFVPFLQAEVAPGASESYTVHLRLDPAIPLGLFLGWLRIETSHPARPVLEVPVRGQVVGDLVARPFAVNLGIVEEGEPVASAISLVNLGSREVHVVKVEPRLPTAAEVRLSRQGKDYRLDIRLPSPPPSWRLDSYINVYTDHPTEPVVQVPVVGWVWAKQPFDRATAEADDAGLLALIKAALSRDEQELSTEAFLAKILGDVRDDRAASLLLRALADDNVAIRPRLIKMLGLLQSRRALEPIRRAVTDDSDFAVRLAALEALIHMAGREALPEVLLALQDDDHWVREDAAWLLIQMGHAQAIPALTHALEDENEHVREAAREALEALSGRGE
jgi:HEAT repeats/Protein of unknown function (DUF1573)